MDPDAALAIIRERIAQYRRDMDSLHDDEDMSVDTIDALESVAHYAEALIEWLDKGGFLPAAWAKPLSIDPGQWPDFTPDGGAFCPAQDPVSGLMCTLRPHDDATMHAGGTGRRIAGIWA